MKIGIRQIFFIFKQPFGLFFYAYSGTVHQSLTTNGSGVMTATGSFKAEADIITGSGKVNFNDKAQVKYNATNECIEFIFS